MELSDPAQRKDLADRLGAIFAGRPVIHGPRVLAGAVREVEMAARHGARRSLVVATIRGAGSIPTDEHADVCWLPEASYESVTEELRHHDRQVRDAPDGVRRAVDAFDPAGQALWWGGAFVTSDTPVQRREVVGGRRSEWLALEDKIAAEDIWEQAGVAHAPSRIVAVEDPERLEAASREIDRGDGVVWAGDNRDGFNGGGNFVRWVTCAEERAAARDFFASRCDRIRVMPFLDGVPCSIHGLVLPDGTAALRPVEIAMLRRPGRREFVYGGLSSFWDPADADRVEMRAAVRRTGEHLRERVGYRGAFGIDGVLTVDGFLPTELNTRLSAGLTTLSEGLADDTLVLLQLACVSGRDPLVTAADAESLVPVLDARRAGKVTGLWEGDFDRSALPETGRTEYFLACSEGRLSRTDEDTGNRLVAARTRTRVGMFSKIEPCTLLSEGDRLAPLNMALMRFLDATYGTGFGDLEAAPDVR